MLTVSTLTLFTGSLALSALGALSGIAARKSENTANVLSSLFGALAALLSLGAGVMAILGGPADPVAFATPFSFAHFSLLLNPLAGLLISVISVLALAAWIFGLSYMDEYKGRGLGFMGFCMNLFIASMLLVIASDNAFWFLVFFELMSLTSYGLVVIEQEQKGIHAGFMYLVMAHIGLILIMAGYLFMAQQVGSFEFSAMRAHDFGPAAGAIFILGFLGFGLKAGMIPFHSWLPLAHPAAPSHVSALMSGGMIKIGIFGIVKLAFDILSQTSMPLWWGLVVLAFGLVSSVLGVVYALVEHDLKKLLAYHSVENIGIILLGVGVAMIGVAQGSVIVTLIGLMAGLYHLINHALFKGLLFLGAGSVLYAAHTKDMDELGGLSHTMKVTSACFLIGALAISAIPPLNGFMSEWFVYQSLFQMAHDGTVVVTVCCVAAAVGLAITGALAVACFVKAYGVTFSGAPRSEHAAQAKEVPASMKFSMVLLAALCVVFGVGASFIVPTLVGVAHASAAAHLGSAAAPVLSSLGVLGLANPANGAVISPLVLATVMIVVALAIGFLRSALSTGGQARMAQPWACGYQPNKAMPVIASSFAANLKHFFAPAYQVRKDISSQSATVSRGFGGLVELCRRIQDWGDRVLIGPVVRLCQGVADKTRLLAQGDFTTYTNYIVIGLVVMLILAQLVS